MKQVGLFGGTFDPIHKGHLQLAREALHVGELERVVFIPTCTPPHKSSPLASFQDRTHMVTLAIEQEPRFELSALEGEFPGKNYTIDTLTFFQDELCQDQVSFSLILGMDAFLDIRSWKNYFELVQKVNLVVIGRRGYDTVNVEDLLETLQYSRTSDTSWRNSAGKVITLSSFSPDLMSSSQIRLGGCDSSFMERFLETSVVEYIYEKKLYGCG